MNENPQKRCHVAPTACNTAPTSTAAAAAAAPATGRVSAFVADITQHEGPGALLQQLPGPVIDYCSMVFVLSAVAPHKMRQVRSRPAAVRLLACRLELALGLVRCVQPLTARDGAAAGHSAVAQDCKGACDDCLTPHCHALTAQALRNVASVLKPGSGWVLFRDYADGDMAQTRLQDSQGVKHIRGNFYARGDGTCCYYFGQVPLPRHTVGYEVKQSGGPLAASRA